MLLRWKKSNDITKYCACKNDKVIVQKENTRFNTSSNTTQLSKAMRYSQLIRQNSPKPITNNFQV